MKRLDRTLAREIKAANGDGSREAKFSLLHKIDDAVKDFSTPNVIRDFDQLLVKHGRAVTAICIAATIWERRERLEGWQLTWAQEVIDLWTTKPKTENGIGRAYIDDGLHPTRICEYAGQFIRLNSED